MSGFKVGDLVECLSTRPRSGAKRGPLNIVVGGMYTVSKACVVHGPKFGTDNQVFLKEAFNPKPSNPREDNGYLALRFRLIHRPRADFIEALKSLPADLVGAE